MSSLLLVLLFLAPREHQIYISLSTFEILEDSSWRIRVQLFHDDLEDALQNKHGKRPTLSEEKVLDHAKNIERYLVSHLILESVDRKRLAYQLNHVYRENDLVVVELVGDGQWPHNKIQITNDLLLEIFASQKNIVKVKNNSRDQLFYFKKGQIQAEISSTSIE